MKKATVWFTFCISGNCRFFFFLILFFFLQLPEDFFAVLINHPYQKINAPLKFNILLHKLLPLLFVLSLFYRTCLKTTLNRNPKEESPNCKNYPASSRNTIPITVWIMPKYRKPLQPFIWWPPIFHTPKHILKKLSKYMKRSGLMSLKWLKQNIGRFRSYIHRLDFPLKKLYPVF